MSTDHVHKQRVSLGDRAIMALLVVSLSAFFLRPFIALQSFTRAHSFVSNKRYQRAATHYRRVVLLDSDNAEGWSWLGFSYKELGKFDQALKAYKRALRLNPQDSHAYHEVGLIYFRKKDFAQAIYYLRKAAEIQPSNWGARHLLALSYLNLGRKELAISVWEEILKDNPDFGEAQEALKRLRAED